MEGRKGATGPRLRSRGLPEEAPTEEGGRRGSERAACLGLTDAFYGPTVDLREEPEEERKQREAFCQSVCSTCPILWPCLRWALVTEEPWGVWGGMPFRRRQQFARFLKKRHKGEIPNDEEVLQDELHHFTVATSKRKQPKPRVIKSNGVGPRPVPAGNRTGGAVQGRSAAKPSSADRANPRSSSGGSGTLRAASPARRSKGVPRRG